MWVLQGFTAWGTEPAHCPDPQAQARWAGEGPGLKPHLGRLSPLLRKPTAEQAPGTERPVPQSEVETWVVTEIRAQQPLGQSTDMLWGPWHFVFSPKKWRIPPRPGPREGTLTVTLGSGYPCSHGPPSSQGS